MGDSRNVTDPDFPEGASTPNEGIQPNILAIFPRKLREIKQKLERRVWGTRAQHPLRSTLVKNHSTIYVIYCCPLIPDKELRRSPIPLKNLRKGVFKAHSYGISTTRTFFGICAWIAMSLIIGNDDANNDDADTLFCLTRFLSSVATS